MHCTLTKCRPKLFHLDRPEVQEVTVYEGREREREGQTRDTGRIEPGPLRQRAGMTPNPNPSILKYKNK